MNNHTKTAIQAAEEAGKILLKHYGQAEVSLKGENYSIESVVTIADHESEHRIVEMLRTEFPEHAIRGEEGSLINEGAEYLWIIDPLDGTSNFIRNIPLFGISIGLLHKGEPILGVLYFPALNLLVRAEQGGGAFANDKKVEVSKRPISEALYYAGGLFNKTQQLVPTLADLAGLVKIIDSSSFEFAQIAMGDAEIYYLKNVPHDVVAGICIVREAGGRVTDGKGENWELSSENILATNGVVHNKALEALK